MIYKFRYRVKNKYGWGPFSNSIDIRAATLPGQPVAPTFSVVNDLYVRISWTAPNNGGNPILAYNIQIRKADLTTFANELAYCDGSQSSIVSNRRCDIPFTQLRSSFNL